MRIGGIRHKVTLQRMNIAGDWEDARTIWAEVTTEEGTNPLRHRIRTRWKRDITADLRIVYRDSVLAMVGPPADLAGTRRELVMICTATGESLHDSEEATVTANGAPITFTRVTLTRDATTYRQTRAVATIAGHFQQTEANKKEYDRVALREVEAITGRFVPTTLGEMVRPGDTAPWGGVTYTVRDADIAAPDGTAAAATVVMVR